MFDERVFGYGLSKCLDFEEVLELNQLSGSRSLILIQLQTSEDQLVDNGVPPIILIGMLCETAGLVVFE